MKNLCSILLLLITTSFSLPEKKRIKILMAGDSTMAIKDSRAFPETGWGMPFVSFWDTSVTVINKARNGASTQTFREEGLWKAILQNTDSGDYVFIQFSHNDEVPTKKSYTKPDCFQFNLKRFINEVREKNATPVLLTSVTRRKFDSTGRQLETHSQYSTLVRQVASETGVVFFDIDKESQELLQQLGMEKSAFLYLHLQRGEHPNYPNGREDDTHFSELGARMVAQLVLNDIREKIPSLALRIVSQKR